MCLCVCECVCVVNWLVKRRKRPEGGRKGYLYSPQRSLDHQISQAHTHQFEDIPKHEPIIASLPKETTRSRQSGHKYGTKIPNVHTNSAKPAGHTTTRTSVHTNLRGWPHNVSDPTPKRRPNRNSIVTYLDHRATAKIERYTQRTQLSLRRSSVIERGGMVLGG